MQFDIFTLFPEMFVGPFDDSIIGRARDAGHISIVLHNIRDYAEGKHRVTDDAPYGGGGGMVMKVEPICRALEDVLSGEDRPTGGVPVILLSPQGRLFTQQVAEELAHRERLALICGRYEGVDERVRKLAATDEISIGDYVLSGGEIAAMVVVDAVTRLLPGVLGDPSATAHDSHSQGLLEHPHYTRPAEFRGLKVPDVLVSGHHAEVARWRRSESLRRTLERRPTLLDQVELTALDRELLAELGWSPAADGEHSS